MKKIIFFIAFCFIFLNIYADMFFADSDHQLEVIKLKGKKKGLTALIFGGIHGDEPGGYFSSEILSKIKMIKGDLIIVPRVNFPGIMMNKRELFGDMNRKFTDFENPDDPDLEVIRILKSLMAEADIFINQHDAYGFHRKNYISINYNPTRFGESLIVDTGAFYSKKFKRLINLEEIGKRIVKKVNSQIKNPKFHFCFWNHNSIKKNTKYKAMKKSATHYALTTFSIPAFGLETSKDLPTLSHKVKYQLLVIKEILKEFGFEFVFPSPKIKIPVLYWIEFLKNNKQRIRINDNTNLRLNKGDKIKVLKIYSNYISGLSADILNWGKLNDLNKDFVFKGNVKKIIVRKNNMIIGKIKLKPYFKNSIRKIILLINNKIKEIPNWGVVELSKQDSLIIKSVYPELKGLKVDFRGFSIKNKRNDSNVVIKYEDLIQKYSFKKLGKLFFVKIYSNSIFSGGFQVIYNN